jgi:hypothetical protein
MAMTPPTRIQVRRIQAGQHLALVERLVAFTLAAALVIAIGLEAAPAVSIAIAAAVAGVVVAATARRIRAATHARRTLRRVHGAPELAELRRELAALPETPHPLGL